MKILLIVMLVLGSISSFAQPYLAQEGDRLAILQESTSLQSWDADSNTDRAVSKLRDQCGQFYGGSLVGTSKCEVLHYTVSDGSGGRYPTRKAFCAQMCKFR